MANDIAAKLAAAVNEDTTDSATEVKEALEKTPAGEETKASAETEKKTGQKTQKQSQAVPYERFEEKNQRVKELEAKLEEYTERDKELSVKLAQLEQSHDVLERIRGLAHDDRYQPLVEKLDKALRGIHEEVQAGEKTEKQADADINKLFRSHKEELEDAFAQQRADVLWQQVQSVSEGMLNSLGEEYDEQDLEAIAKLWNPATDWDAIEENPDVMRDELLKSLKHVVETYGEPRGALKAKVKQFEEKAQQTPEKTVQADPEQELKGIFEKDWGKTKVSNDGKYAGPELSDEEFSATMARVMKMGRR